MLSYDAVIVTRNRPHALALSLPLLIDQSRPPKQLIIVDSSDDPRATEAVVQSCSKDTGQPTKLIHSSPGITLQRNIGLKLVDAEVTFFPDDDSLVLPGALESMMRIYERDTSNLIGGVCGADEATAPSTIQAADVEYRMKTSDQFRRLIAITRYRLEEYLFLDPFKTFGRQLSAKRPVPDWLHEEEAVPVEWMTGYRMSFRTNSIRQIGFDERLRRYALFEDVDASFGVAKTQLLIGARKAKIHHYKSPEARGAGRTMGVTQILNRAYVLAKHGALEGKVVRDLHGFSRYKLGQYAIAAVASSFGRARFLGALHAYRKLNNLLDATGDVQETYLALSSTLLSES